jgi:hypothetical protein
MKLGIVPENFVERLALLSGMLPPGIVECWFGLLPYGRPQPGLLVSQSSAASRP